jgi:hypothetical protein
MGDELYLGRHDNVTLDYSNITFEERDAHDNVMFYPPKTYL